MPLRNPLAVMMALAAYGAAAARADRTSPPPIWTVDEAGRRRPAHEGNGKFRGNSRMRPPKRNQGRMKYGDRYYGQTAAAMNRSRARRGELRP